MMRKLVCHTEEAGRSWSENSVSTCQKTSVQLFVCVFQDNAALKPDGEQQGAADRRQDDFLPLVLFCVFRFWWLR